MIFITQLVTTHAIYVDEVMVGFAMYTYYNEEDLKTVSGNIYYLWRFMIDKNHQGKGYGKQAMEKIVTEIEQQPFGKSDFFCTSIEPQNIGARNLYKYVGFKETSEMFANEKLLIRKLNKASKS